MMHQHKSTPEGHVTENMTTKRQRESQLPQATDTSPADSAHGDKRIKVEDTANDPDTIIVAIAQNRADQATRDVRALLPPHKPADPYFHPDIKQIEAMVPEALRQLTKAYKLEESGMAQTPLGKTILKITKLKDPVDHYPICKPAVLIGHMGAGKSQLVCSLLNPPEAAITTDDSERGTNVPHEYVRRKPDQKTMFVVDAFFHSTEKIKSLISAYCSAIYVYLRLSRAEQAAENDSEADEIEATDIIQAQAEYESAIKGLFSLLCNPDMEDFDHADNMAEWFAAQESAGVDIETLVTDFMADIQTFLKQRDAKHGIESHTANDASELMDIFSKVSRGDPDDGEPTRHPRLLIRVVRIHYNHDVLNEGAILADTPGLNDTDPLISKAAEDYLNLAGSIFVVTPFLRCASATEVDEYLKMGVDLRKPTYLITTKVDHKGKGKSGEMSSNGHEQIAIIDEEIWRLEEELQRLTRSKEELVAENKFEEAFALDRSLDEVASRLAATQSERDSKRVELRRLQRQHELKAACDKVQGQLSGKLRRLGRSDLEPDLKVYFTAATEYEKYRIQDPDDPPELDVDSTGIPDVLRALYKFAAHGKFDTLERICLKELPPLLHGLIGILSKTTLEKHQDFRKELIDAVNTRCEEVLGELRNLAAPIDQHITGTFTENQNKKWPRDARSLMASWQRIHPKTFHTFCKRNGRWRDNRDRNKAAPSWNSQIQDVIADPARQNFDCLVRHIVKRRDATSAKDIARDFDCKMRFSTRHSQPLPSVGDQVFARLEQKLDEMSFQDSANSEGFMQAIADKKLELAECFKALMTSLATAVDRVKTAVLIQDGDDSSIGMHMLDTYEKAAAITTAEQVPVKVKGVKTLSKAQTAHQKRKELITHRLTSTKSSDMGGPSNLFRDVGDTVRQAWESSFEIWICEAEDMLSTACDEVIADFDNRYKGEMEHAEEEFEGKEMLLEAAREALNQLEGPIRGLLEGCRGWDA